MADISHGCINLVRGSSHKANSGIYHTRANKNSAPPGGFSGTLDSTNKIRVVENAVVLLRFEVLCFCVEGWGICGSSCC